MNILQYIVQYIVSLNIKSVFCIKIKAKKKTFRTPRFRIDAGI